MKSHIFRNTTSFFDVVCVVPDRMSEVFLNLIFKGDQDKISMIKSSMEEFRPQSAEEFHELLEKFIKKFFTDLDDIEVQNIILDDAPMLVISTNENIRNFFKSLAESSPNDTGSFFVEGPDTIQ